MTSECPRYIHIEVLLPPSTQFAISSDWQMDCIGGNLIDNQWHALPNCPSQPGGGALHGTGWWTLDRADGSRWDVQAIAAPQKTGWLTLAFPLVSDAVLNQEPLRFYVEAYLSPQDPPETFFEELTPSLLISTATPSIEYPAPSASLIRRTSAHLSAVVHNRRCGGTASIDFGSTTSYGTQITEQPVVEPTELDRSLGQDVGTGGSPVPPLTPATTYYWRTRFTNGAQITITGDNQSFTTLPDFLQPVVAAFQDRPLGQYEVFAPYGSYVQRYWYDGFRTGGSWHTGEQIGNRVMGGPAAFANVYAGASTHFEVFVHEDDHIQHYWWNGQWHKGLTLGMEVQGSPAAFQNWARAGHYEVFVPQGDHIQHHWYDGSWHLASQVGSNVQGTPAAFENGFSGNHIELFVPEDDHVRHHWFDGSWHQAQSFGTNIRGAPAAFINRFGNGHYELFVPEGDQIQHHWFDGTMWHMGERLGSNIRGGAAAFQNQLGGGSRGHYEVFVPEGDHIQHHWFDGTTWHLGTALT